MNIQVRPGIRSLLSHSAHDSYEQHKRLRECSFDLRTKDYPSGTPLYLPDGMGGMVPLLGVHYRDKSLSPDLFFDESWWWDRHVLIEGPEGSGSRQFILELHEYLQGKREQSVIYVPLWRLNGAPDSDEPLMDFILGMRLRNIVVRPDDILRDSKRWIDGGREETKEELQEWLETPQDNKWKRERLPKVTLLLEGLEDLDQREPVLDELQSYWQQLPNIRIIMTHDGDHPELPMPAYYGEASMLLPTAGIRSAYLRDDKLNIREEEGFFDGVEGAGWLGVFAYKDSLSEAKNESHLYAWLAAVIDCDVHEYHKEFAERRMKHLDMPGYRSFALESLLPFVAWWMHTQQVHAISSAELTGIVRDYLDDPQLTGEPGSAADDELRSIASICPFFGPDNRSYRFTFAPFRDFFAALYIRNAILAAERRYALPMELLQNQIFLTPELWKVLRLMAKGTRLSKVCRLQIRRALESSLDAPSAAALCSLLRVIVREVEGLYPE